MSVSKARVGGQWQTLSGSTPSVIPPSAPTDVVADSPTAGSAHVTWTASTNTGHGTITNYIVTTTRVSNSSTSETTFGAVTAGTVTGLVDGAAYTFTVRARNSAGDSPQSSSSAQVTIVSVAIPTLLHVSTDNARYFANASNAIVYLGGSHTWQNLVDSGHGNPPATIFDYNAYISFLTARNHNFFRLWRWEQARYSNETSDADYYFDPPVYKRTGPGTALDGQLKFDLNQFHQPYFDRLRARIIQAGQAGMYVGVMLFNGWSVGYKGTFTLGQPFNGHPFNVNNNINSINGDTNGDGDGFETQDMSVSAITTLQEAYLRKVADTLSDLPNVLYEVANEADSGGNGYLWQYHMIDYMHNYEQTTYGAKHPVGMTIEFPVGNLTRLNNSNAEWISYGGSLTNPTAVNGTKVVIADTDHSCGTCNGSAEWAWAAFTRGLYLQIMDVYDGAGYGNGAGSTGNTLNDAASENSRYNVGKVREYAARIDLKLAVPSGSRCSSGFCLAKVGTGSDQYISWVSAGGSFTMDLSGSTGTLNVEWYNPATRVSTSAGTTPTGGATTGFTAPFGGAAVLFLYA